MTERPDDSPPKPPAIPNPPSKAELDQLSKDQALITDEWAPDDLPEPAP